jgi:hypothetical protein
VDGSVRRIERDQYSLREPPVKLLEATWLTTGRQTTMPTFQRALISVL